MENKLSERQARILNFISLYIQNNQTPPTVREIRDGCEISSTSVAAYNIHQLEMKRHLSVKRNSSRGIRLLNQPMTFEFADCPNCGVHFPVQRNGSLS